MKGGCFMLDEIREAIAEQLSIPVENITEDTRLIEDLKADSLDIVELVMDLEQRYNIEIPDEELVRIKTVGDIVKFVEK